MSQKLNQYSLEFKKSAIKLALLERQINRTNAVTADKVWLILFLLDRLLEFYWKHAYLGLLVIFGYMYIIMV